MKNTRFLQPHRSYVSGKRAYLLLALLVVLMAALSPRWLQSGLLSLAEPVWGMRAALAESAVSARERLFSREELEAENRRLREENARLMFRGALYDELAAEAARLERLLGRAPENGQRILARVLASPAASPYDSLVIDAGETEGVREGDAVVFDGTIALGTVDLVTERTSRVALFSSPGSVHEVYAGTTTARLEAMGQGGGAFVIEAPKEMSFASSDAIILAGTQQALAFVVRADSSESDAFQTVHAVMPVNLFETREVLVLPSFTP